MTPLTRSALAGAALALTACTTGMTDQSTTGALIGGVAGAALGNAIGDDTQSTIIGGIAGAVIGGAIGDNLARQEQELAQQLAGSGATITNTGSQLMVILPEGVTFPTGSSVVNASFLPALREVARSLLAHPNSTILVEGHTDNVGTEAFNMQLSIDRALSVARILVSDGVSYSRMTYAGRGFSQPVASNSTSSGRAMNRRVEIIITPTG